MSEDYLPIISVILSVSDVFRFPLDFGPILEIFFKNLWSILGPGTVCRILGSPTFSQSVVRNTLKMYVSIPGRLSVSSLTWILGLFLEPIDPIRFLHRFSVENFRKIQNAVPPYEIGSEGRVPSAEISTINFVPVYAFIRFLFFALKTVDFSRFISVSGKRRPLETYEY